MQPTTLGHYRLDDAIGRGGMGEVYCALDTRLNRPAAIKIMQGSTGKRERSVLRFLRESHAASALNHPNIVTIHDVGEMQSGDHFIVQELVEGSTLRSLLEEPLPFPRALGIGPGRDSGRASPARGGDQPRGAAGNSLRAAGADPRLRHARLCPLSASHLRQIGWL